MKVKGKLENGFEYEVDDVVLNDYEMLEAIAEAQSTNPLKITTEIPGIAVDLVEVNDKPMTVIYPGAVAGEPDAPGDRWHLARNAVAEDGSVGIRIPMAEFCRELAFKLGRPIVSTSANISGEPTPRRFSEIPDAVKDAVDFVVPPSFDTESTGTASQIIKVGLGGEVEIIRK